MEAVTAVLPWRCLWVIGGGDRVHLLRRLLERIKLYRLLRNEYESLELREWFARDFRVEVGLYSYGCFDRFRIPGPARIGRYCSFARTARVVDANHPFDALSTHPYLYEQQFGVIDRDLISASCLVVEDDVWVSHNATITPGCKHVGRGAVIGAGAVVTKDVPAYAIVAGAPARVLRYRFPPALQQAIDASRWWEMDKRQLAEIARTDPGLLFAPTVEHLAAFASPSRSERGSSN